MWTVDSDWPRIEHLQTDGRGVQIKEEHKDTETMTDLFFIPKHHISTLPHAPMEPSFVVPPPTPHTLPWDHDAARSRMCTCAIIAQQECTILSPCNELGFGDKAVRS